MNGLHASVLLAVFGGCVAAVQLVGAMIAYDSANDVPKRYWQVIAATLCVPAIPLFARLLIAAVLS